MKVVEVVELEASAEGTIVEVLRVVDPKDAVEPVKTRIVEWLDEHTFRSAQHSGEQTLTSYSGCSLTHRLQRSATDERQQYNEAADGGTGAAPPPANA